jgi:hypothetical protein
MTRLREAWRGVRLAALTTPGLRVMLLAIRNYVMHQSANQAGSLAFSSVLAMFPLLILLSASAGYIGQPGEAAALVGRVMGYAPQLVRDAMQPVIEQVLAQRSRALLTVGVLAIGSRLQSLVQGPCHDTGWSFRRLTAVSSRNVGAERIHRARSGRADPISRKNGERRMPSHTQSHSLFLF